MRTAKDRRIQLPDDLPEGRAELIVLYPDTAPAEDGASGHARRKPAKGTKLAKASPGLRSGVPAADDRVSYFARLTSRQPSPLSAEASRALDESDRGER